MFESKNITNAARVQKLKKQKPTGDRQTRHSKTTYVTSVGREVDWGSVVPTLRRDW